MPEVEALESAIYRTINNVELWRDVLELLCAYTGATKGIIMLRDRQTAELVIPSDVQHNLASPLLYGLTNKEIESYITDYVQFDPWTEYEKLFHPSLPYALSKYVSLDQLKKSRFWDWLHPQKISDTVVLKIGESSSDWVAMNLFYWSENAGVKTRILELTTKLQSIMREAWHLGQQVRACRQGASRLQFLLNRRLYAALALESNGRIISMNNEAEQMCREKNSLFSVRNEKVFIKNKRLNTQFSEALKNLATNSDFAFEKESSNYILKLELMDKDVDLIGADKGARLLSILKDSKKAICLEKPIWELSSLTTRQSQLVKILAKGGRVVDFYKKYNLKKVTGHKHWGNVKEKLKVENTSEIYAIHQLYLQNL